MSFKVKTCYHNREPDLAPKGNHDIVFKLLATNKGNKKIKILSAEYLIVSKPTGSGKVKQIPTMEDIELALGQDCPELLTWPIKFSGERVERELKYLKLIGSDSKVLAELEQDCLNLITRKINEEFSS